jgi:hypothetical protein
MCRSVGSSLVTNAAFCRGDILTFAPYAGYSICRFVEYLRRNFACFNERLNKGQPPPARHLANAMTRLATMLIVASLVGCHRSPTAMIPMDRDTAAALKIVAPASVAAAKLIRQCHTDPTVADGRYRGRRLLVSGTCLQVTADELRVGPGSSAAAPAGPPAGYVSCHGPDWTPLEPGKVTDNSDSAGMAWTNGTKPGIAVTVEGTFKTCVPGSVPILVECKIVTSVRPYAYGKNTPGP